MAKSDTQKISIRFFNDHEVRAIWDEENSKWWFSAIDIIRAINNEDDYVKAGNYWRWLKKKFATDNIQLVSLTHDFKFQAPDGKKRAADALDYDGVQILAKNFPNNNAVRFLDWFNYSDSTKIKALLQNALTDKINDRETFMKGIDYSYYYEEN